MYEKLLPSFGYVLINNVKLVVSHIEESYPEDEHGQARLGGYDPSTYQWVGILVFLYIYIYIYMPCVFPEKSFNWLYAWIIMLHVYKLRFY